MSEKQPKAVANDTVQTTTNRRGELCSPVFICYELTGDRRSPLRVDIEFNLIAAVNNYIFVSLFGGSKPPPYRVGYKFTFTDNRIFIAFL